VDITGHTGYTVDYRDPDGGSHYTELSELLDWTDNPKIVEDNLRATQDFMAREPNCVLYYERLAHAHLTELESEYQICSIAHYKSLDIAFSCSADVIEVTTDEWQVLSTKDGPVSTAQSLDDMVNGDSPVSRCHI
jgi:hypothetical protein